MGPHVRDRPDGRQVYHRLKMWPEPFQETWDGRKPWEYRVNDRDFRVCDYAVLEEWNPDTSQYTGRWQAGPIVLVAVGGRFGMPAGYCVFTFEVEDAGFQGDTEVPSFIGEEATHA